MRSITTILSLVAFIISLYDFYNGEYMDALTWLNFAFIGAILAKLDSMGENGQ